MMQTIVMAMRHGGPEVLEVVRAEVPKPAPGELLIRVVAAGVSFADVAIRRGVYPFPVRVPVVPGYDVVGSVEEIAGEQPGHLRALRKGQLVAALTQVGGYAEYVCVKSALVVPVPDDVDPYEAVSLVLNYTTAYQMLHRTARAKPGQKVLVHNAAGGVGSALLQLGKLAELTIYGTASARKHTLVQEQGAVPIDYKQHDFSVELRRLVPEGVDFVFEGLGYRWWPSWRLVRPGGRLIAYGMGAFAESHWHLYGGMLVRLMQLGAMKGLPGPGVSLYSMPMTKKLHPQWFLADLAEIFGLLSHKKIKPLIACRLPLERAAFAHRMLEGGEVCGKIVLSATN